MTSATDSSKCVCVCVCVLRGGGRQQHSHTHRSHFRAARSKQRTVTVSNSTVAAPSRRSRNTTVTPRARYSRGTARGHTSQSLSTAWPGAAHQRHSRRRCPTARSRQHTGHVTVAAPQHCHGSTPGTVPATSRLFLISDRRVSNLGLRQVKYTNLFVRNKSTSPTTFVAVIRDQYYHGFVAFRAELVERVTMQQFFNAELGTEVTHTVMTGIRSHSCGY